MKYFNELSGMVKSYKDVLASLKYEWLEKLAVDNSTDGIQLSIQKGENIAWKEKGNDMQPNA